MKQELKNKLDAAKVRIIEAQARAEEAMAERAELELASMKKAMETKK